MTTLWAGCFAIKWLKVHVVFLSHALLISHDSAPSPDLCAFCPARAARAYCSGGSPFSDGPNLVSRHKFGELLPAHTFTLSLFLRRNPLNVTFAYMKIAQFAFVITNTKYNIGTSQGL